jgi:hypothetical protein
MEGDAVLIDGDSCEWRPGGALVGEAKTVWDSIDGLPPTFTFECGRLYVTTKACNLVTYGGFVKPALVRDSRQRRRKLWE